MGNESDTFSFNGKYTTIVVKQPDDEKTEGNDKQAEQGDCEEHRKEETFKLPEDDDEEDYSNDFEWIS